MVLPIVITGVEIGIAIVIIVLTSVACFREAAFLEDQGLSGLVPSLMHTLRAMTIVSDVLLVLLVVLFRKSSFVAQSKVVISCGAALVFLITFILSFVMQNQLVNSFSKGVSANKEIRDAIHCCLWANVTSDCEFQVTCRNVIMDMVKQRLPVFQGLIFTGVLCWIALAAVFYVEGQMIRPRQPLTNHVKLSDVCTRVPTQL